MKTGFELENLGHNPLTAQALIIGCSPKSSPYVAIVLSNSHQFYIKDKDLERFAVNILKALKSKKLK